MANFPREPAVPSEGDTVLAKQMSDAIEGADHADLRIQVAAAGRKVSTFDLPPLVARFLTGILKETAAGHAVALVPIEEEITTEQAAKLLNVSRPYLVGMIEKGVLPARLVGNQRRLPLKDVLAYKAANRAKRRETLRELAAFDQELGLE